MNRYILKTVEHCKDCPNFGWVDVDYELPGDKYGRASCDEIGSFRLPKNFETKDHYIYHKCPLLTKNKVLKIIDR